MLIAKAQQDSIAIAEILNQSGMVDDNFGQYMSSLEKYQQAADIYRSLNNKKGEATELIRIGVVRSRNGNFDEAILRFLQALTLSQTINDKAGMFEAYVTLAEGYMGLKQYNVALSYLKTAEQIDKHLPFSSIRINMLNNKGISYRELAEYDQAVIALQKGFSLTRRPGMEGLNITVANTLATVYQKNGNKELALNILLSSLKKSRKIKNFIRESNTLANLGDFYEEDNPQKAIEYLNLQLKNAEINKSYQQEVLALNKLAKLNSRLGNYELAYKQQTRSHQLSDSVYYRFMLQDASNSRAKYQLANSEEKLKVLSIRNKEQKEDQWKLWSLVGTLAIIMLVVGYNYGRMNRLNKLLKKTNTDLKESNSVKDKLFSIIAHDLRSPMASVINILPFFSDEDTSQEEREVLTNQLLENCNASLDTLNQLLSWGEMQIKGIRLTKTKFPLYPEIEKVLALLHPLATKKFIILKNQIKQDVVLKMDKDHLRFIIRNFLSNAIKFTPRGGAVVIYSQLLNDERIKVTVKDTGIGIAPNRIKNIFSINNHSTDGTNQEKGTSLGLVMCREFTEANGGTITVESRENEGSAFSIILSLA